MASPTLKVGGGLAEVVEAAGRLVRHGPQPLDDDTPAGSLERDLHLRTARGGRLDRRSHVDPLLDVVPRDRAALDDIADHERPHASRAAQKTACRSARGTAHHPPARARREPAPVRLDTLVAGPPVRQVVRLGEKLPDVLRRGEEQRTRHDPHSTPTRVRNQSTRAEMKSRSPGELAIAATTTPSAA